MEPRSRPWLVVVVWALAAIAAAVAVATVETAETIETKPGAAENDPPCGCSEGGTPR